MLMKNPILHLPRIAHNYHSPWLSVLWRKEILEACYRRAIVAHTSNPDTSLIGIGDVPREAN